MLPGPPCIIIQNIPHIILKQENEKEKRKKMVRAVIHMVDVEFECTQSEYNTTGAPHNAVAIQSKCAKEGPAIFQHRTYTYLCLITFCELEVQWRHKGTCLHVARDCMITWGFSRSARVHSPGGPHTSDKYTTGVLHMVCEMKYAIYNMGHAWQKGCYTLLAKIERPPNGCV